MGRQQYDAEPGREHDRPQPDGERFDGQAALGRPLDRRTAEPGQQVVPLDGGDDQAGDDRDGAHTAGDQVPHPGVGGPAGLVPQSVGDQHDDGRQGEQEWYGAGLPVGRGDGHRNVQ